MSLYNLMNGMHPLAGDLLWRLGYKSIDEVRGIPRLRDVFLYSDEIRILTRTGGGNRPDYHDGNAALMAREGYLRNWDDTYDSTFAWWAYEWPDKYRDDLRQTLDMITENHPELLPADLREITDRGIERMKVSFERDHPKVKT